MHRHWTSVVCVKATWFLHLYFPLGTIYFLIESMIEKKKKFLQLNNPNHLRTHHTINLPATTLLSTTQFDPFAIR